MLNCDRNITQHAMRASPLQVTKVKDRCYLFAVLPWWINVRAGPHMRKASRFDNVGVGTKRERRRSFGGVSHSKISLARSLF
jgi:hypothetical protein